MREGGQSLGQRRQVAGHGSGPARRLQRDIALGRHDRRDRGRGLPALLRNRGSGGDLALGRDLGGPCETVHRGVEDRLAHAQFGLPFQQRPGEVPVHGCVHGRDPSRSPAPRQ